jgi:hypothetical protein
MPLVNTTAKQASARFLIKDGEMRKPSRWQGRTFGLPVDEGSGDSYDAEVT